MKTENLAQQTWTRFRRSRLAVAAVIYVCVIATVAALAPLLANAPPVVIFGSLTLQPPVPYSPNAINLPGRLQPPGNGHHLGTDDLGRDVLARIIHGARVSLAVGLLATALSLVVGSILGALAGYYGGAVDWIVSRVIEVILCFPFLFLVLAIVALFRPSLYTIMIALGLTSWTTEARYVRGEFLRIRG